jgi:hypothetical protein
MTQRQPRLYDPGYLAFLRQKPCCVCGHAAPSEAAHIRMGKLEIGKPSTGMAEKPSDRFAVPLCGPDFQTSWVGCHQQQHTMSEESFWKLWADNADPFAVAARLYAEYGGTGGKRKKRTTIKPRLPREKRAKIQSRSTFR